MLSILIYFIIISFSVLQIIQAVFSSFTKESDETKGIMNKLPSLRLFIPVLLGIPFVLETFSNKKEYGISFFSAVENALFVSEEGRSFLMLVTLYILSSLLLQRLEGHKYIKVMLPLGEGILTIIILQLNNQLMEYSGWLGFLAPSVYIVSLSILIALSSSLGKLQARDESILAFKKKIYKMGGVSLGLFVLSTIIMAVLSVPDYVQSWMLNYGQIVFIIHLLTVMLLLLVLRNYLLLYTEKVDLKKDVAKQSLRFQALTGWFLLLLTSILMNVRPPQEVLRTLEDVSLSPIIQLLIGSKLSNYQVIQFDASPMVFLIIYLGGMLLLVSIVILLFTRYITGGLVTSLLFIAVVYVGSMFSVQPGDILVDNTVFPKVETAIAASYEKGQDIELLYQSEEGNDLYLVYAVNQEDLGIEKLEVVDGGYKRTPLSGLVIEDAMWGQQSAAITTRKLEEGYWLKDGKQYAYLSFGYVGKTPEATEVKMEFKGNELVIPVNENKVFFHVETSNVNYSESYQAKVLDKNGEELEIYKYNSMTGSFHH